MVWVIGGISCSDEAARMQKPQRMSTFESFFLDYFHCTFTFHKKFGCRKSLNIPKDIFTRGPNPGSVLQHRRREESMFPHITIPEYLIVPNVTTKLSPASPLLVSSDPKCFVWNVAKRKAAHRHAGSRTCLASLLDRGLRWLIDSQHCYRLIFLCLS